MAPSEQSWEWPVKVVDGGEEITSGGNPNFIQRSGDEMAGPLSGPDGTQDRNYVNLRQLKVVDAKAGQAIAVAGSTAAALDDKADKSSIGVIDGIAGLDAFGKVPIAQLPAGLGGGGSLALAPVATADLTAEINKFYPLDTSGGSFNFILPDVSDGAYITGRDHAQTWDINPVIMKGNVENSVEDFELDGGDLIQLIRQGGTWRIITPTRAVADGIGGVSSWNDLLDKPPTFAPSIHAASHLTGGIDPVVIDGGQVDLASGQTLQEAIDSGSIGGSSGIVTSGIGNDSGLPGADLNEVLIGLDNGKLDLTADIPQGQVTGLTTALSGKIASTLLGATNGVAQLDGSGKVPNSQLNITGATYKGVWDANTNTPALAANTGTNGDFYRVAVAGTRDIGPGTIDYSVGDAVVYNSAIAQWEQIGTAQTVTSVLGRTGAVVAVAGDYTTGQIGGISPYAQTVLDDVDGPAMRATLGLLGAATRAIGTTAGTVPDGADSRFVTTSSYLNSATAGGTISIALAQTEVAIGSVVITPSSSLSKVQINAAMEATKDANTTARTVAMRIRRGTLISSPQVGQDRQGLSPIIASTKYSPPSFSGIDSPGSAAPVTYTIYATVLTAGASTAVRFEITATELRASGAINDLAVASANVFSGALLPSGGPVADGIADDRTALLAQLASIPDGGVWKFPKNQTFLVSTPIFILQSLAVDLRGSKIIAPLGFLNIGNRKNGYAAGAYFTTVRDAASFTIPAGVTIITGDVLYLSSNTTRVTLGGYKHGQIVEVAAVSAGVAYLKQAFYAAFQVDTIYVCSPYRFSIHDGKVEMSGAAQVATGYSAYGTFCTYPISRFLAEGIDCNDDTGYAWFGVSAQAATIRIRDCVSRGIVDRGGIPGGGRVGYGISAGGDDVLVENCSTYGCKHGVDVGNDRTSVTRTARIVDSRGFTLDGTAGDTVTTQDANTEAKYQYQLGAHANVHRLQIVRPHVEGVNDLVGVRNGWAEIIDPVLRSLDSAGSPYEYLINCYETPLERLYVRNAKANFKQVDYAGGTGPSFLAGWQHNYPGAHGHIEIDGSWQDGGGLFQMYSGSGLNGQTTLEKLRCANNRGKVCRGIMLGGVSAYTMGKITTIEWIKPNLVADPTTGGFASSTSALFELSYMSGVDQLTIDAELLDVQTNGSPAPCINIGNVAQAIELPDVLKVTGRVKGYVGGVQVGSSNVTGGQNLGSANFDGLLCDHYSAGSTGLVGHGVFFQLSAAPAFLPTFRGAKIFAGNAGATAANRLPIKFSNQGLADISGLYHNALSGDLSSLPFWGISGYPSDVRSQATAYTLIHDSIKLFTDRRATLDSLASPPAARWAGQEIHLTTPVAATRMGVKATATGANWKDLPSLAA